MLFRVGAHSEHYVNMVRHERGSRLSLTGWCSTYSADGARAVDEWRRRHAEAAEPPLLIDGA